MNVPRSSTRTLQMGPQVRNQSRQLHGKATFIIIKSGEKNIRKTSIIKNSLITWFAPNLPCSPDRLLKRAVRIASDVAPLKTRTEVHDDIHRTLSWTLSSSLYFTWKVGFIGVLFQSSVKTHLLAKIMGHQYWRSTLYQRVGWKLPARVRPAWHTDCSSPR